MLADTVDILNADGTSTFSMNADTGGSGIFTPLRNFDVEIADRSNATRYKQQKRGAWGTRSYEGEMTIHVEGSLFADTPDDYWSARQDLLTALRGLPDADVTTYYRGTLYVKPASFTERIYAKFGPLVFSAPLEGDTPGGTAFLFTVTSFVPYFIGETSGDFFWWS